MKDLRCTCWPNSESKCPFHSISRTDECCYQENEELKRKLAIAVEAFECIHKFGPSIAYDAVSGQVSELWSCQAKAREALDKIGL